MGSIGVDEPNLTTGEVAVVLECCPHVAKQWAIGRKGVWRLPGGHLRITRQAIDEHIGTLPDWERERRLALLARVLRERAARVARRERRDR